MSGITRRTIMQSAALLPLQAIKSSAQNSAIRIGICGVGNRGSYEGKMIAQDSRTKVVAVCDVDKKRAAGAAALAGDLYEVRQDHCMRASLRRSQRGAHPAGAGPRVRRSARAYLPADPERCARCRSGGRGHG